MLAKAPKRPCHKWENESAVYRENDLCVVYEMILTLARWWDKAFKGSDFAWMGLGSKRMLKRRRRVHISLRFLCIATSVTQQRYGNLRHAIRTNGIGLILEIRSMNAGNWITFTARRVIILCERCADARFHSHCINHECGNRITVLPSTRRPSYWTNLKRALILATFVDLFYAIVRLSVDTIKES